MFLAMKLMILGLVRRAKSDQRMAEMKLTKELIFLVKNSGGTIKELAKACRERVDRPAGSPEQTVRDDLMARRDALPNFQISGSDLAALARSSLPT